MPSVNSLRFAISDSATSLTLSTTCDFPESGVVQIESELVAYTHATDVGLSGLVRGYAGTTAAAHIEKKLVTFVRSFQESSEKLSALSLTDPLAINVQDVNFYNYFLVTTTGAVVLTIPSPSDTREQEVAFFHNDSSTGTLTVNTKTVDVGTTIQFSWDGTAWLPVMAAGSTIPDDLVANTLTLTGTAAFTQKTGLGHLKIETYDGWVTFDQADGNGTIVDFASGGVQEDVYIYVPGSGDTAAPIEFVSLEAREYQFSADNHPILIMSPALVSGAANAGSLNMVNRPIINVAGPFTANDASTKGYVDGKFTGGVTGTFANPTSITVSNGIITAIS